MNFREKIELTILAAIIFLDDFATVGYILNAKNFKIKESALIFTAAKNLYPTTPVTVLTLQIELKRLNIENANILSQNLYKIDRHLGTKINTAFWCYLLLEYDLKEKFQDEIILWRDRRKSEYAQIEIAVLTEIFEMISHQTDVFELVEKSIAYFKLHNMAFEFEEATNFYENVCKRVMQIKKTATLDIALKALYNIQSSSKEIRIECEKFKDAIASMIITNTAKPEHKQAANLLT